MAASPTEAVPSVPHHRSPCTASCPPPFLFSSSLATSLPVSDYPVFSLIFSLAAFLCSFISWPFLQCAGDAAESCLLLFPTDHQVPPLYC